MYQIHIIIKTKKFIYQICYVTMVYVRRRSYRQYGGNFRGKKYQQGKKQNRMAVFSANCWAWVMVVVVKGKKHNP
jgi:hypothetical protein